MVKAKVLRPTGRTLLALGLTHADLDKLRASGDNYIHIDGTDTGGLPIDVLIWSQETDAGLSATVDSQITPDTKVNIDPTLKNPVQTRQ